VSFTRATSSTAVALSVDFFSCEPGELAAAHASFAKGVVETTDQVALLLPEWRQGQKGLLTQSCLPAGASTTSGFSSAGSKTLP